MRTRSVARVVLYGAMALAIVGAGCKKPVAAVTPPPAPAPAPPPPQPTVTLQANPPNVQRGQTTTLRWSSTNATSLTLAPGVGNVSPEGNTNVTPTDSATYTITAMGPGGSATATTRVTVTVPPPPPVAAAPAPSMEELFAKEVMDAFYDYDKSDLRADARSALTQTAGFLKSYPQVKVTIEGHCDERGSTEYNLALGDRRAQAAKDFLVSLGVASDRMTTVSYGKERPFCNEHNEQCMQQNRRAHFAMAR